MADNGFGKSITAVCAKSAVSFSGYIEEQVRPSECETWDIKSEVCRISIFPHDQRPEVTGSLVAVFDVNAIEPCAFASSPSAVTVVVCSSDFHVMMEKLFGSFSFPDGGSYLEWRAVRRMDEQLLSEVRCSYSEHIITIYGIARQTGLDLWDVSLPIEHMGWFGAFLSGLGELDVKLPFLVSNSASLEKGIHFSFALRADLREKVGQALDKHPPGCDHSCRGPVSALFVHGPHFGDRYGIANTFVTVLRNADIPLLALSCTVSTVSAVIEGNDPTKAVEVLSTRFQIPDRRPWTRSSA
jgi:aspartokinase